MRSIILLSAIAACRAFVFPVDLPDGVYSVPIDGDGNALSEPRLVESLPATKDHGILDRRQAPRLPKPSTNCHQDRSLNREDYNIAFQAFNTICDRAEMYPANSSMVVSSGTAMAYLCNYNADNRCWSSESNEADGLMNSSCGNNGIGWVFIGQYSKSYGRENKGISIC
ncbi:hypothetical protein QBC47DRAFT_397561 [Echria macrotheca]|uniref:Uncharacterized protein n=1 Tax=Echria macrotheca TaxID=438768 RepID=A0AAJ0BNU8_9PEZI|nr:hypothetical protein QBC47DRAFT_397561 [Echria macrotheca]